MNTIQFTKKITVIRNKKTLDTITSENLDVMLLEDERIINPPSEAFVANGHKLTQPSEKDVAAFIDYITNVHHRYIRENAIIIQDLAQEVLYKQNHNHPELANLASAVFLVLHDILNHMMREEKILFANIKQLMERNAAPGGIMYTTFGLIQSSVRAMQLDHQSAQESLSLFRELTNDYQAPENACSTYKHLFAKLQEFDQNYLLHMQIENDILFPIALGLDGN